MIAKKTDIYYNKTPFLAVLIIYLLCFSFRVCEYFILRTDQTFWGEAFVHKLIGIVILCMTVKITSFTFEEIGFSKVNIMQNLLKGLLLGLSMFAFAYSIEIIICGSKQCSYQQCLR